MRVAVFSVWCGGAHPQARRAMKTVAMIFALALVGFIAVLPFKVLGSVRQRMILHLPYCVLRTG
jgi:hypothetical protein